MIVVIVNIVIIVIVIIIIIIAIIIGVIVIVGRQLSVIRDHIFREKLCMAFH